MLHSKRAPLAHLNPLPIHRNRKSVTVKPSYLMMLCRINPTLMTCDSVEHVRHVSQCDTCQSQAFQFHFLFSLALVLRVPQRQRQSKSQELCCVGGTPWWSPKRPTLLTNSESVSLSSLSLSTPSESLSLSFFVIKSFHFLDSFLGSVFSFSSSFSQF